MTHGRRKHTRVKGPRIEKGHVRTALRSDERSRSCTSLNTVLSTPRLLGTYYMLDSLLRWLHVSIPGTLRRHRKRPASIIRPHLPSLSCLPACTSARLHVCLPARSSTLSQDPRTTPTHALGSQNLRPLASVVQGGVVGDARKERKHARVYRRSLWWNHPGRNPNQTKQKVLPPFAPRKRTGNMPPDVSNIFCLLQVGGTRYT